MCSTFFSCFLLIIQKRLSLSLWWNARKDIVAEFPGQKTTTITTRQAGTSLSLSLSGTFLSPLFLSPSPSPRIVYVKIISKKYNFPIFFCEKFAEAKDGGIIISGSNSKRFFSWFRAG